MDEKLKKETQWRWEGLEKINKPEIKFIEQIGRRATEGKLISEVLQQIEEQLNLSLSIESATFEQENQEKFLKALPKASMVRSSAS